MNQLPGDLLDVYALIYLNGIVIFSGIEKKHLKHVNMVFDKLAKFKYYI